MSDKIDTSRERIEWLAGILESKNAYSGAKALRALVAERDEWRDQAEEAEADFRALQVRVIQQAGIEADSAIDAVWRLRDHIRKLETENAVLRKERDGCGRELDTAVANATRALQRAEAAEADFRFLRFAVIEEAGVETDSAMGAVLRLRERAEKAEKALRELDVNCTCDPEYSRRGLQDPHCPAAEYGDIAREGLGLPPRCQYNRAVMRNEGGDDE